MKTSWRSWLAGMMIAAGMVFPKGYRLGLTVDGTDYVGAGGSPIWHTDPDDRPEREFGGTSRFILAATINRM